VQATIRSRHARGRPDDAFLATVKSLPMSRFSPATTIRATDDHMAEDGLTLSASSLLATSIARNRPAH
jgi:hypothetical protein